MDWVPNSDLFVAPNRIDEFDCELEVKNAGQCCRVVQSYSVENAAGQDTIVNDEIKLSDVQKWNDWFASQVFVPDDATLTLASIPQNGFCILFIPRAVDAELTESTIASGFTDLPMSEDHWKKVANAFHLPGHFTKVATRRLTSIITICRTCEFSQVREKLWMHTFTINPKSHQAFAVAATHFESCKFTFSIMVGCTDDQINNVKRLVAGWQDASGHPLLMLGICAELELNRLENLIGKQRLAYQGLMEKIEDDAVSVGHDRFSWELIKEVRSIRDESKTVEEETETTKLQLSKAILPGIKTLLDQYANDGTSRGGENLDATPSAATTSGATIAIPVTTTATPTLIAIEQNRETFVEITNLFSERFNDILSRLDGLSAKCRIYVEGISFTTDIIRSELARQEANISTQNTKFGTAISFVALVFLPATAIATIFAMPIFGWTNDWIDLSFHPIKQDNTSSSNSGSNNGPNLPVVSGYIWVYLIIAVVITLATLGIFLCYISNITGPRVPDGGTPNAGTAPPATPLTPTPTPTSTPMTSTTQPIQALVSSTTIRSQASSTATRSNSGGGHTGHQSALRRRFTQSGPSASTPNLPNLRQVVDTLPARASTIGVSSTGRPVDGMSEFRRENAAHAGPSLPPDLV